MKKLLFLVFLFICMISNVNALKITSLGDSIPNGFLLSDSLESYDNKFAKELNADFYEYSFPGMITEDLLKDLDKEEIKQNIQNSDLVFINIGSGDLLDLIQDIDFSKFGFNSNQNLDLTNISVIELKNYIVDVFTNKLEPKVDQVLTNFSLNFKEIIKKIKSYNPNIKIYVSSAYNPFFDISIPFVLDLSEIEKITDNAIKAFNDILKSSDEYDVIDIYSILRNVEYLNINPLNGSFDPHPNILGHDKIYGKYLEELCYKVRYEDKDYYVLKGGSIDIKPKEKKGYTFEKWNYDINKIDKDIELKEIYKKDINYLYFIIPGSLLVILFVIIKIKKNH